MSNDNESLARAIVDEMERRRAAEEQRRLADVLEAEAEAHRQAIRAASEEDERCRKAGGGVVNMLLAAL